MQIDDANVYYLRGQAFAPPVGLNTWQRARRKARQVRWLLLMALGDLRAILWGEFEPFAVDEQDLEAPVAGTVERPAQRRAIPGRVIDFAAARRRLRAP